MSGGTFEPKTKFGPLEYTLADIRKVLRPEISPRDEAILYLLKEHAILRREYKKARNQIRSIPVKESC